MVRGIAMSREPEVGDVVGGYRLERSLGSGGMGQVFAATHCDSGDRVAIKLMHADDLDDPTAVKRFLREARAAGALDHPNVARVHGQGALDDGTPFLVMELLEGESLDAVVRRPERLPIDEAVDYVVQACRGVAAVHAEGIIHRDLKPGNLFVIHSPEGARVKVLDFGISKMRVVGDTTSLTRPGSMLGSPQYMSPEQLKDSRTVDVRSDVWALGVVAYRLLTRKHPFGASTFGELFAKIHTAPPPRLRQLRPEVPDELERVIMRCLEKDPARRFQTVAHLEQALAPFADHEVEVDGGLPPETDEAGGTRVIPGDGDAGRPADPTREAPTLLRTANLTDAELARALPVAIVVLLVVLAAAVAVLSGRPSSAPVIATAAPDGPTVEVRLVVSPEDASVTVDGRPVDVAEPLGLPRGEQPHTVVAEAPGYQAMTRELFATESRTLVMELVPRLDRPSHVDPGHAAAEVKDFRLHRVNKRLSVAFFEVVNVGQVPIDAPRGVLTMSGAMGEGTRSCRPPFVYRLRPGERIPCAILVVGSGWRAYETSAELLVDPSERRRAELRMTGLAFQPMRGAIRVSGEIVNESDFIAMGLVVVIGLYHDDQLVGAGHHRLGEGTKLGPGGTMPFDGGILAVEAPDEVRAIVFGYDR